MEVVSVNIGKATPIEAKSGKSGIFKHAVNSAYVGPLGLQGDAIVDVKHHGGPDQAVYAYTRDDYDWWETILGEPVPNTTFGENLTLDRWPADVICVGDRLHIGDVVLEVTSPRIPCVTLDARMGRQGFANTFLKAHRPGPYFRVIQDAEVSAGMPVTVVSFKGVRKRLLDWPGLFGPPLRTQDDIDSWLAVPVHHKMRRQLEEASK